MKKYGLSQYDAGIIVGIKALADYFEEVNHISAIIPKRSLTGFGRFYAFGQGREGGFLQSLLDAAKLADIINMVRDGVINRNTAKKVFAEVWHDNLDPKAYVEKQSGHGRRRQPDQRRCDEGFWKIILKLWRNIKAEK